MALAIGQMRRSRPPHTGGGGNPTGGQGYKWPSPRPFPCPVLQWRAHVSPHPPVCPYAHPLARHVHQPRCWVEGWCCSRALVSSYLWQGEGGLACRLGFGFGRSGGGGGASTVSDHGQGIGAGQCARWRAGGFGAWEHARRRKGGRGGEPRLEHPLGTMFRTKEANDFYGVTKLRRPHGAPVCMRHRGRGAST